MIDYIKGEVIELTPTYAVLENSGIGYCIHVSLPSYSQLQDQTRAKLFVYEHIREDSYSLYGFLTQGERQLFLLLISVSGIGANTARVILSAYSAEEIKAMIVNENVAALNAIKGIGTKTAQRIILDLKDKIQKVMGATEVSTVVVNNQTKNEAVAALVMLGFSATVSQKVVDKISLEQPEVGVGALIKLALKMM